MALGECKRKASVPSRMLDSHLLYLAFRVALAFCPGERVKETFLLLYPSFLWEIIVFPYTFLEGCFLWDFFCRSDMEEESIYIYRGKKGVLFSRDKMSACFFAAECGVCV